MELFLIFILSIFLLQFSQEIVPNWNLDVAAVKLLTGDSITLTIVDRDMYGMKVKLTKTISKNENGITQKNYLKIGDDGNEIEVGFENIESFYYLNKIHIICPRGKYQPYDATNKKNFSLSDFEEKGNWDLKCYKHNTNYFLLFYLMNGYKNFFYSPSSSTFSWRTKNFIGSGELYDFKLEDGKETNDNSGYKKYKMGALVLDNGYLKLKSLMAEFHAHNSNDELVFIDDSNTANPNYKNIIEAKNYKQAAFNNNTNEFYFFTYNNISDFTSGYSNATTNDFSSIGNVQIHINQQSPFEFVDEAEIIEIDFVLNNKYIYYTINNTKTGKLNHGLYDIKLDKIMFNTDEDVETFIPYSSNSILVITKEGAFKVCPIKNGDNCIEECTSNNVIRDSDGNKCGDTCGNNKILLIPDNICQDECDSSIYTSNETHCGLCRDMNSSNPYKLINTTECISNVITGAEIYNSNLYLLTCKKGYILSNNICIPHCYSSCETCSDYSENEDEHKCLTCKEGYYLEGEQCNKIIPTTIFTTIPTTILTTIPTTLVTTIPTTIITTIPTTIATTIPTTIITTIPTTIITTIPTTILTTIPTTIITTIPTTIPEVECSEENSEKCLKCNEESNKLGLCLSCKEGYEKVNYTSSIYAAFLDCMKRDNPKLKTFYFNETLNEFRPCYKTCNSCYIGGDELANNCFECKDGYMFRPGENPKNNCVIYSEFYYISPYGQYKTLDVLQCPEESKFLIKDTKSCIDDCKNDKEYKYLYNGQCLKSCPEGMTAKDFICFENKDECTLVESDIYLKKDEDFKMIKTLAKTYLVEFNYTTKHISLYSNNDYSIIFYRDRSCIDELSLSMPKIDFKECYNKVQTEYGIKEELLVSIVDQKGTKGASPFFYFFHPLSGEELNYTKICFNEKITIKENVTSILENQNNSNYELQQSLIDQGINIFDLESPFYNDLCFDFDNPEKRDIPLSMRVEKSFPNATLCEPGCKTNGIQLPEKIAICDCSMNDLANKDLIKNNALLEESIGKVLDIISSSNIMVLTCGKYIFKSFARSIGGWITLILLVTHIICVLLYFLFDSSKLKIYIFSLTENYLSYLKAGNFQNENAPPKKHSLKNSLQDDQSNKIKKKVKIIRPFKKENNPKNKNILKRFDTTNDIKKKEKERANVGNPLLTITKIKSANSNDILVHLKEKADGKSKLALLEDSGKPKQNKIDSINFRLNEKTENIKFFEEYMATYPDDMEFDDAIIKDKRNFLQCLIENLKEKQMIAFTFFADDKIKIRVMKLMLFIVNIILYFVITGIFFDEEYILELYNIKDEEENFFSYIPRYIDKLFYTTLVSIIIGYIVELFFIDEKKIRGIYKREKDDINILKKEIILFTRSVITNYIAFIIFVFVILLISFYYLLCFNYVYPKTQIEWIKCSVTIIVIMQILSILNCLLITSLRFLSFKLKSPKIYKVSKLLD